MGNIELQNIVKAILQAAKYPVMLKELCEVFKDEREVETADIQEAIETLLREDDPVKELRPIAGGYHYQIRKKYVHWIQKMRSKDLKSDPLPRVLTEVLAIIAYKQPVSRGEIEWLRGRQTSITVFGQLEERQWIKVVGRGGENNRAALYGTTKEFLRYFGLNSIGDLPSLPELLGVEENVEIT